MKMHLSPKLYSPAVEQAPTRNGYGEGLVEAGKKYPEVVALCADLTESTRTEGFKKAFPERFIEIGVAEQLLATVASGMANYGKIPFMSSYAAFSPGRNWEQIRTTIALNNVPVKIAGMHAGISVGPDGATHQQLEDIALMRAMPNMTVIVPTDAIESRKATLAAAIYLKPVYLRFGREKVPVITTEKTPFKIGRAEIYREGKDVTVIACGSLVYEALIAAEHLKKTISVQVINCHTIKPLDSKTILRAVRKTRAVVTAEEHQVTGGLGGAVAELLGKAYPVPLEMIGVQDRFGESGQPGELMRKFGLTSTGIIAAVKRAVRRK
ncbi:transketolase family protein [Candidatus Woesearchaeota archaeon]|nr:transketolase family protein [Candidatus Woesearchaeota archaeon]